MDATITPNRFLEAYMLDKVTAMFPAFRFVSGDRFCWSPTESSITYCADSVDDEGCWALLHETGHALLGHSGYDTDYELLRMEIEAWEKAKEIGSQLSIDISEDHIQECLDSYRDWLYKRSICPECGTKTIQNDDTNSYSCFNCHACWQVSPSRFCRAYRTLKPEKEQLLI